MKSTIIANAASPETHLCKRVLFFVVLKTQNFNEGFNETITKLVVFKFCDSFIKILIKFWV